MLRSRSAADRLLEHFEAGRRLCYDDITRRLGVTRRHARRLIGELREAGYAVEEEREGRVKHFSLPPAHRRRDMDVLRLSAREALALSIAGGAARAMLSSTPLEAPLRDGFQQLVRRLSEHVDLLDLDRQPERWYFGAVARNRIDPDVFEVLLQGQNGEQSVRIDYAKPGGAPSTDRKIDPLCFAVLGNTILITAYCHKRRALRDFALTRIARAALCDPSDELKPYFDRPEGFEPARYYADDRLSALAGGEPAVYRIRVEPEVAHLFREKDYHHSQDIEHTDPDGSLTVSFVLANQKEFRSFAQSWGTRVTVLEPEALARQMREEAEVLAARYASAQDGVAQDGAAVSG